MDVHHSPGRLDQGILVLALPLNLPAHPAILYAVNRFPIPNGVIMLQYVRRRIIGVVHYPVGIHAMEVVLEVRQEQGVHAHCVDEHMLNIDYNWGELNVFSRTSYDVEDCIQPLMAMSKCAAPEIEPVDIDVTDTVAFTWEIQ